MATKTFSRSDKKFSSYYEKNGYISDPDSFNNLDEILQDVKTNIEKAWNDFAKSHRLLPMKFDKDLRKNRRGEAYIEAESKQFMPNDPLLKNAFKFFVQDFFSGRGIDTGVDEGVFKFKPYIWTTVNVSWESASGGTNGTSLRFADEDDGAYYDIRDKKWYTRKEYHKAHPEIF